MQDTQFTQIETELFNDIHNCLSDSLCAMEVLFGLDGIHDKVIGPDLKDKEFFRKSHAWKMLSQGIDYALYGIEPVDEASMSVPAFLENFLYVASSDMQKPSDHWQNIVVMADGRYALDEGAPLSLSMVALLANVDVRTVRNAISAGDLVALKPDEHGMLSKEIRLVNASARRWLQGRRGFKPTVQRSLTRIALQEVQTPAQFGVFMTAQSKHLAESTQQTAPTTHVHSLLTTEALQMLEAGVFDLPLSTVFPLADLYQLDRKSFLQCVMRVFFAEELAAL